MIAFKTLSALDQFPLIHAKAREVVADILSTIWPSDRDLIITRIADKAEGQATQIHTCGPPHRALDFRTRNLPLQTAQRIERAINAAWEYDPNRPGKNVALLHDAGSGDHLHVQVCDRTRRRAE